MIDPHALEQIMRDAERTETRRKRRFERVDRIEGLLSTIITPGGTTIDPGALPPPLSAPRGTELVSGGQVTWIAGYGYLVAAGTGYINGTLISWPDQTITLDAADPSDARIDVIGIDNTTVVFKVTGLASANPSEPVVDPATQLKLALVTVEAGSTEPSTVTTETIYAEDTGAPGEWDWTTSGAGFDLASTSNPHTGTLAIEGTAVDPDAYIQGEKTAGTVDPDDYGQVVLFLRFTALWDPSRSLQITLRNAGVQVGAALRIPSDFPELDGSNTTNYQALIIPMARFAVPSGTVVNQLRLQALGSGGDPIGFDLDNISLRAGGVIQVGLDQDQADARYLRQSLNLADLADVATARTNLGLSQLAVREVDGSPTETEPVALEFPNGTLTEPSTGVVRYTPAVSTDEKAKVSSNDTTPGYLNGKLVGGANVTLTENNDGGNETLTIAASGSGDALDVGQLHEHAINEDLTAETNSSKTTFILANEAEPETTAVYQEGLRLRLGTDYTEAATYDAITLNVAPTAGDVLLVDYVTA